MIDKSTFFFSHFLVFFEQITNFFLFLFLSSPPFFYFIILFLFYFLLSFSAPSFFFARFSYTQKETSSPLEYTRTFGLLPLAFCSAAKQQYKNKLFHDNHQPPPFLSC